VATITTAPAERTRSDLRPRQAAETGSSNYERLPGDEVIPDATWQLDRSIEIAVPSADVWPWLVQMGHGRAGFYTFRIIEDAPGALRSLLGRSPPKVRRILPGYQHLEPGDLIPDAQGGVITWTVEIVDPPNTLVFSTARRLLTQRMVDPANPPNATWYQASWAFVLRPLADDRTWLRVRWRSRQTFSHPALERPILAALGCVDALMHRKQLQTIKQLAEREEVHPIRNPRLWAHGATAGAVTALSIRRARQVRSASSARAPRRGRTYSREGDTPADRHPAVVGLVRGRIPTQEVGAR
jgi:hypothetical protein